MKARDLNKAKYHQVAFILQIRFTNSQIFPAISKKSLVVELDLEK